MFYLLFYKFYNKANQKVWMQNQSEKKLQMFWSL